MQVIEADSSLCGRGKSTEARRHINQSEDSFVMASPTLRLNKEHADNIEFSLCIDSNTVRGTQSVSDCLYDAVLDGAARVLCTTHASAKVLLSAAYDLVSDTKAGFHLVIDEAMEGAIKDAEITIDKAVWPVLDAMLVFTPWQNNPHVYEVSTKDDGGLVELASGKSECEVLGTSPRLKEVAQHIIDPLYLTLIPRKTYERFHCKLAECGQGLFSCVSLIRRGCFEGFKSVKCLSAFFPRTEFAMALSFQGVSFSDVTPPEQSGVHANSHRLHIHYFTEETWTRTLRERADSKGVSNNRKVLDFIRTDVGDRKLIYNTAVPDRDEAEALLSTGVLVTETHGCNDYRDYDCAAFLGSRNLSPEGGRIVEALGISREAIDMARGGLAGYQFFMRTDLRNEDSERRVDIFCCDRRMVDFMLDVFPDATVTKHDLGLQYEKLEDARKSNGGSREGSGRTSPYPPHFTDSDKRAYRRYRRSGGDLSPDVWIQQERLKVAC